MRYVLDTDTCITFLRGRHALIRQRMAAVSDGDIVVPSPVRAELYYGAARSRDPQHARAGVDGFIGRFVSLPFDDLAADSYGRIRAELAGQGMLIGPNDLLIASISLAYGLTLVTHNTREFARVADLTLDDWTL